ncbi:MAG: DNA-directed RNA polymerase subunit H [Candidatus Thermoplasmatota archaeon]|nr:DNA-directed RNA polymerase subunit H [Candidatus Thermoplasmatota archaeon]
MSSFHVMKHELVPEHRLLPEKEAEQVLKMYGITRDQLPKIRKEDPCIKLLERVEGEIPVGSLIKIIRRSPTAGEALSYRVVVAKSFQDINLSEVMFSFEEE